MKDAVKDARKRIERAMSQNGPFTHNMIGLALSMLSKELGHEAANKLVDDYDLDTLYQIKKVKVSKKKS